MNSLYHWQVIAGIKSEDGKTIEDSVAVQVYAGSEKEALEKASLLITRPYYRVSSVIESIDIHGVHERIADAIEDQTNEGKMPWEKK